MYLPKCATTPPRERERYRNAGMSDGPPQESERCSRNDRMPRSPFSIFGYADGPDLRINRDLQASW